MALTGFDPEQVKISINNVVKAYNELIDQIGDRMQKGFVDGMADKWACNQAQIFFSNFKTSIDYLNKEVNLTFQSVVDAMNTAAMAWSESTESVYATIPVSLRLVSINIDNIVENINGVRGIDLQLSSSISGILPIIQNSALEALEHAKSAVVECGFIGGTQAESLISSLDAIGRIIESEILKITDQSKNAIDDTIATYSDVEGRVSQAFQGK